ncbi:MAG: GtrA family protein [Muribaculaceae bacterium]|nr:GtrA family protein [Muribaculaceae bacterium]
MNEDQRKTTIIQFLKYSITGAMNTLITVVSFYVCNTLLHIPATVANPISYVLGLINSFLLNRKWVFKSEDNVGHDALRFFIGFIICYGVQYVAFILLMNVLKDVHISWLPMKHTGENIAFLLAMGCYTLLNFFYNKFVAFKK